METETTQSNTKKVRIIPATKAKFNKTDQEKPKIKVAAYCRVSTDSDEQASSYEAQVAHYTSYISSNKDWINAGVYADDGISGTSTKHREQFNKMIDECLNGNIEMVITKSISRFARNTIDCLKYIRLLKDKGIPVFFEKENINTMDSKGEVLITIMASLAQQESESLSQNVRIGLKYRYQEGIVRTGRIYGYDKDENKNLVINPEQAKAIRGMFQDYLDGDSCRKICKNLKDRGVKTMNGNTTWHPDTVRRILSNEKYMGDALLQKTYSKDVLNPRRITNNGELDQYYVSNSHEAIVSKEVFEAVQKEKERRKSMREDEKRCYCKKHALSGLIFCGECGDYYRRCTWKCKEGYKVVYRCNKRIEEGNDVCGARKIEETEIKRGIIKGLIKALTNGDNVIDKNELNMIESLNDEKHNIKALDKEIADLQKEIIRRVEAGLDFASLDEKMKTLRNKRESTLLSNSKVVTQSEQLKQDITKLKEGKHIKLNENLVKYTINKILVNKSDLEIEFKSGVKVRVDGV